MSMLIVIHHGKSLDNSHLMKATLYYVCYFTFVPGFLLKLIMTDFLLDISVAFVSNISFSRWMFVPRAKCFRSLAHKLSQT